MSYLRNFALLAALLLGAIATVNWWVDPYGVLGSPIHQGFNQSKLTNQRMAKPLQIISFQPDTVVLGSSRVMNGVDPADWPNRRLYNFGIPAATMEELDVYARHAMSLSSVRMLLLSLDYPAFDDEAPLRPGFQPELTGPWTRWKALPKLLLSQKALLKCRSVMTASRKGEASGLPANGFFPSEAKGASPSNAPVYANSFARVRHQERFLLMLEQLLTDAKSQGVSTALFIPPLHASAMEAIDQKGLRPAYQNWLSRLAAISDHLQVPLWDFSGWNSVTTVSFANSQTLFIDSGHMRPQVVKEVVDTVLNGKGSPDFGRQLHAESMADYIQEQQAARMAWQAARPDDLADIVSNLAMR